VSSIVGYSPLSQHDATENNMSNEPATKKTFTVPPDLAEHWMSLEEACTKLSVTRFTVSNWCQEKILERKSYGRYTLISRASVEKYLKRFLPGQATATTSGKKSAKRKASR
jgi:excisionase family DNA binding protein